ncbi:hypothetical protein E2C01_043457 [Portunus trituberculatus]|uniref:Uncharacterized protein n=1 Tax=Portunus trituberculatus TaxID=210409 RepID=A0A5B7FXM4_PORTR|nr:hypothetical protein [Portunus trituberculatus]
MLPLRKRDIIAGEETGREKGGGGVLIMVRDNMLMAWQKQWE